MNSASLSPSRPPLLDVGRGPDALSAMLMVVGAVGLGVVFYMLFTEGHAAFNTSSDVAWGAPIAYYLFFLLTSSGLSIIASLDSVFGLNTFYPVAKRCTFLAIITLVAGFTVLALEIGHPFRMLWAMPLSLQVMSPMWWMGVLYSIDLVLLIIKFYLVHRGNWHGRFSHAVAIVSFVVCILAPGTLGLVFGMMAMRPAWFSPVMPMYFILTGFTSAVAFLLFFTSLIARNGNASSHVFHLYDEILPRLFLISLLAVIGMRFGQIVTGLWSNYEGMEAHREMIRGPPLFWIDVIVGLALPSLMMATDAVRRRPGVQFFAAVFFMIGIFASRLDLLIVGQKVPLFRGQWTGFVEYWPSLTEWMLIPAGFGLFLLLYGAGNWMLRLSDTPQAARA